MVAMARQYQSSNEWSQYHEIRQIKINWLPLTVLIPFIAQSELIEPVLPQAAKLGITC